MIGAEVLMNNLQPGTFRQAINKNSLILSTSMTGEHGYSITRIVWTSTFLWGISLSESEVEQTLVA